MPRRRPLLAAMAGTLLLLATGTASMAADALFNGPVRLVVPYGVGGGTDYVARLIAPELASKIGVPVVVENRPGAGGIPGSSMVATAPPDGRTLLLTAGILVQAPALYSKLPFDVTTDFAPISVIGRGPLVLVGREGLPGDTLQGFINEAKKTPDKFNYASVAVASTSHLYGEQLNRVAGVKLAHIPYNSGGAALTALLAKEVDVAFLDYQLVLPHFQTGKIKPLGINGTQRLGDKKIPTLQEQGLNGFEAVGFYGVLAPKDTPPAVVARLAGALSDIAQQPTIKDTLLERQYLQAWGSTPEEFAQMIREDRASWADIVKAAGVKLD
jgi:tripartite-type tricarboxylate transporter receptor subunit TctC